MLAKIRLGWLLVVMLAGLYQLNLVGRGYVAPMLEKVTPLMRLPAWYRTAILGEGRTYAEYFIFLRSQVPGDARVIIPPFFPQRPVAHVGFMQYILYPREIHNCGLDEVEACVLRATGPRTFILGLPDFPPRGLAEGVKRYVPFRDGFGVYAPK